MVTTPFTSAQAAFAVAASGPGRILGIQIGVTGTGVITVYDNATAASGTIVLAIPASPTAGSFYTAGSPGIGIPYSNGLWIVPAASSPTGTVLSSPGTPNDGRTAT